jgi:hypothetical protein
MKDSSEHNMGNSPHPGEDAILDLLHGLLPGPEADRLLAHLAACPPCEELFRERAAERERLRAGRVLRTAPGGDLVIGRPEEEIRDPAALDGRGPGSVGHGWGRFFDGLRPFRYRPATGLVAALAVLLAVLLPRLSGSPESDHLRWLPTSFNDARFRASTASVPSRAFEEGLQAYSRHDLKRAIRNLEEAQVSEPLETIRRVYLGSALAWSGRFPEAVDALQDVADPALPDPWGSEARWTLWVALMGTGRASTADSLLSVLAEEPGEVGRRARAQSESGTE